MFVGIIYVSCLRFIKVRGCNFDERLRLRMAIHRILQRNVTFQHCRPLLKRHLPTIAQGGLLIHPQQLTCSHCSSPQGSTSSMIRFFSDEKNRFASYLFCVRNCQISHYSSVDSQVILLPLQVRYIWRLLGDWKKRTSFAGMFGGIKARQVCLESV